MITAIAYRKGRWRKKSIVAVPAGQGSGKDVPLEPDQI